MGTDDRPPASNLIEQFNREPHRFDFFQAVRLVELLRPEMYPVGHGGKNREAVAFTSHVGLGFPASDLVKAEIPDDENEPAHMSVAFMGLAGSSGPLPTPFTELIIQRNAARDNASSAFLDIFNNRLVSFLYRSRKKHRVALNNLHPDKTVIARWLFSLAGLGFGLNNSEIKSSARFLLKYAGLMSNQTRSMTTLEKMLSNFFKVSVYGEQLLGSWLDIQPSDRTLLGYRKGINNKLGVNMVVGRRSWDQMGRIRLHLTLESIKNLNKFLPTGESYVELNRLTRLYLQQDIDVELSITFAPTQRSGIQLAGIGSVRLAWTAWLQGGKRPSMNYDPVRLRLPKLDVSLKYSN